MNDYTIKRFLLLIQILYLCIKCYILTLTRIFLKHSHPTHLYGVCVCILNLRLTLPHIINTQINNEIRCWKCRRMIDLWYRWICLAEYKLHFDAFDPQLGNCPCFRFNRHGTSIYKGRRANMLLVTIYIDVVGIHTYVSIYSPKHAKNNVRAVTRAPISQIDWYSYFRVSFRFRTFTHKKTTNPIYHNNVTSYTRFRHCPIAGARYCLCRANTNSM